MAEEKAKQKRGEHTTSAEDRKAPEAEVKAGGGEETQAKMDEAQEKGYIGESDPVIPNEEWSLESGPDSPDAEDVRLAVATADVERGRRR
jgi:hypothetical protein